MRFTSYKVPIKAPVSTGGDGNGNGGGTPTSEPMETALTGIIDWSGTTSLTVTSNALWVEIYVAGTAQGSPMPSTGVVTVNGAEWEIGDKVKFEQTVDPATNKIKTLPQFVIECNGQTVSVKGQR